MKLPVMFRAASGPLAGLALLVTGSQFAVAADLAPYYYPEEPVAELAPGCVGSAPGRPVENVWRQPQTAYIVASKCTQPAGYDYAPGTRTDEIYVYYDGESTHKTDIRKLLVPR